MKQFNPNATKLIISFVEQSKKENIKWEINEIPIANMQEDNVSKSENSNEVLFIPYEGANSYRAVLYVNMYEGNIELYNDDEDREITEFDIEELTEEDNE